MNLTSLGARVKQIRRLRGVTQREMAAAIGVTQTTITLIESDKRRASRQVILAVCREYGVREQRLLAGQGEIFEPEPRTVAEALAAKYPNITPAAVTLIEKFAALPPPTQEAVLDFLREVVADADTFNPSSTDAVRAELERQLEAEKKTASKASSS